MVPVVRCYYCREYIVVAEITEFQLCDSCEILEDEDSSWMSDESEEYVLYDYEPSEFVHVTRAKWEEEE